MLAPHPLDSRRHLVLFGLLLSAAAVLPASRAWSAAQHVGKANPDFAPHAPQAANPWTEERMRAATPMPLPRAEPGLVPVPEELYAAEAAGAEQPAAPPEELASTIGWSNAGPSAVQPHAGDVDAPSSFGTSGCRFSSSRLVPLNADKKYPHIAVGKLFFTKPGDGDYVCSGAVLNKRIVLTAGHCVHRGSGGVGGFFTNFRFCPAWRGKPNAKYKCWDWAHVWVTGDWSVSNGLVPNAADYGMLVIRDQVIGGVVRRIGDVTGHFGYSTVSLSSNHAHLLGYPVNFDLGNKMHQVTAGRCFSGGNNTERYGSDMTGGSSGGPWVQDFGQLANGQTVNGVSPNLIIGVTSYGNVSPDPKYQGSSILDSRFTSLLSSACATPFNCS